MLMKDLLRDVESLANQIQNEHADKRGCSVLGACVLVIGRDLIEALKRIETKLNTQIKILESEDL